MQVGFIRKAHWLNAARLRAYLWILALVNLAALLFLVATASGGIDRNGFLLGTDFLSFWTAGRMLVEGADVYDTAAHVAAQREFFASEDGYVAFFYPPPFLLLCYPLGFLPYFWALALWLLATGAAYFFAARQWLRNSGILTSPWLLAAAFPPVLITINHGQTSFLAAALLGLATLLVRKMPIAAGICFGLAIIKPQFGLLVPLVLMLTGEWRVIAYAAATALLLGFAATFAFGPTIWAGWLESAGAAQTALSDGTVGFAKMQSPFAAAMLLGAPVGLAHAIQGGVALAVVGAIWRLSWRSSYSLALGSAMLAGAPLITPFILDYDLAILAFPLIWLAGRQVGQGEAMIAVLTFVAAAFARPLAVTTGLPIMPFILAGFFALLVRRAWETQSAGQDKQV